MGQTPLGLGFFTGVLVLGCCWTCVWFVFIKNGQNAILPLCPRDSYRVQMRDMTKFTWSQHRLSFIPTMPQMETHTLPPRSTIKSIQAVASATFYWSFEPKLF